MDKIILSIFLGLLLISCGGNDCTSSDFIGSYLGTIFCSDNESEDISVLITEGNNDSIVMDIDGESYDIEVDGCNLIIPESSFEFLGLVTTVSGEGELDGNILSITQNVTAFGITETCNITLVR